MVPAFSTFNKVLGMFIWGLIIMAVYFTNTWNTGYLPIVSNRVFDHFGEYYNVSRTLDDRGMYDHEKYMNYSAAYLGAANTVLYAAFFGIYTAAITHVILFHRYEITMGFKNLWASIRRKKPGAVEGGEYKDVHNRLMAAYPEGMRPISSSPHMQRVSISDHENQSPSGGISLPWSLPPASALLEWLAGQPSPLPAWCRTVWLSPSSS